MSRTGSRAAGIALATMLAGPVFITSIALASFFRMLPAPVVVSGQNILIYLALLIPSMIVGAFLAGLPNLIGTVALAALADTQDWARPLPVWMLTGAVIGMIITFVTAGPRSDPATMFALVATSAICAGLCRCFLRWQD